MGGLKCSLADGWVGSMIATVVSDILFGTPKPIRSRVNLGVLSEDKVNIIVHGHEPTLSEMLAVASTRPGTAGLREGEGRDGHQHRRHLLHGERSADAPRPAHRGQLPAAGTGHPHRRGGDDDRRRAVRDAVAARGDEVLPHQAGEHLGDRADLQRRADHLRCGERLRARRRADPRRPSTTSRNRDQARCASRRSRWTWWPGSPTRPSSTCWAGASAARSGR